MPGAGFKKRARGWRKHVIAMAQVPWDAAKRGYVSILSTLDMFIT